MVTRLQSSGRSVLTDEKHISSFSDLMPKPDLKPELLTRLSSRLQITLDVEQILEIFFSEIKHSVLVDGISYSNSNQNIMLSFGKSGIHSCSYRLTTQKDYLGELVFTRSTRFREHELANIEGLISTLVYPLRNGLRYSEALAAAFRDPLTGAGNRIALDKTLTREIELSKRNGIPLSALMLDLDYFKSINDTYGHAMGDTVLKEVVDIVSSCVRQTDMCFRYGGEEFFVLLSSADSEDARVIAERIRKAIEATVFEHPTKGSFKVTASLGSATLYPQDTMNTLCERADEAMYKAKNGGRNLVVTDREEALLATN